MAEPECPECAAQGVDNITSKLTPPGGEYPNPMLDIYKVIFCNQCGHIYGVFPKS